MQMDSICVHGGVCLQGKVKIQGSKNASLPILAATLLTGGENVYAQHDRALEHGYGGAQYSDGAILGRKLNVEW